MVKSNTGLDDTCMQDMIDIYNIYPFYYFHAVLLYTVEMAESDIASEYGVPQFECTVKQQKKEHYDNGHEETDDDSGNDAAVSM